MRKSLSRRRKEKRLKWRERKRNRRRRRKEEGGRIKWRSLVNQFCFFLLVLLVTQILLYSIRCVKSFLTAILPPKRSYNLRMELPGVKIVK